MIQEDKLLHFGFSFIIALLDPGLAVFAGVGKELLDLATGGIIDTADLAADAAGIIFALIVSPIW